MFQTHQSSTIATYQNLAALISKTVPAAAVEVASVSTNFSDVLYEEIEVQFTYKWVRRGFLFNTLKTS